MKNNSTDIIIRFFPFSLFRIESLTKYLNKMYNYGYKIIEIKFGCILIFKKSAFRNDLKYIILTRHFYRHARKRKWNDIEFLESINSYFCKDNGKQFDVYSPEASIRYYVYLIKSISDDDYLNLLKYRKNRLFRVNIIKFLFYLFLLFVFFCVVINVMQYILL
jgi:hypothetical protein